MLSAGVASAGGSSLCFPRQVGSQTGDTRQGLVVGKKVTVSLS